VTDTPTTMPPYHTALRSFFRVALHHGCQLHPEHLAAGDGVNAMRSVLRIMREAGFKGRVVKGCTWENLGALGTAYPVMTVKKDGHWCIVVQTIVTADGPTAVVMDPLNETAGMTLMPRANFLEIWSGTLILCKRVHSINDERQPFGFRWFMPEILRNKRTFRDIGIAALMSSVLSFATPLLYNVVIDKVVPHQSYQTLYVIVLVFLVATAFDSLFGYVRQYLMLFASNKIDARLASRVFQHLMALPLPFFEHTPAGVLTRHLQQTEKIRQFLTGRLFQTLLDCVTLPILILMLLFYSAKLMLVVLAFSAAMALVIAVMLPTFRNHLNQLYQAEGARQAHLVETIHGMRTIKSLCMEKLQNNLWDTKVAAAVKRHATVGRFSALANVLTSTLDKLMQISILGIGAQSVFDGNMSIGALVAFNMLSNRVSGPLVQMVALINEYQETALSVKMLGTVMDHPPERDPSVQGVRPEITGDMEFDNVVFTYPGAATPALDRVTFKITEGQMIGVVGRSGSGKTTVTRLIQGIHAPQSGLIRVNGVDIRQIDLPHLRRSIGVVLQDNFLFRGTIRENIAATKPEASLTEVAEAARLAAAAEFIERLPRSYDTVIEEGASNLSGGQRQRIATARALLMKPRLLIFDEATSALDPESEAIVQANLSEMARGRTMIVVSHRLSSLVQADAILVLEQGQVMDLAPHPILIERCEIYAHLWQQQTQHIHSPSSQREPTSACAL
jgi:ATP-binding cassette, subfamily B, bacterial HlyB/CyaB